MINHHIKRCKRGIEISQVLHQICKVAKIRSIRAAPIGWKTKNILRVFVGKEVMEFFRWADRRLGLFPITSKIKRSIIKNFPSRMNCAWFCKNPVCNTMKNICGINWKCLPLRCSLESRNVIVPQRFYAALQLVHAGLVKRNTTLWFCIDVARNNAPIIRCVYRGFCSAKLTFGFFALISSGGVNY